MKSRFAVLLVAIALLASGCSSSSDDTSTLRVLHLSPDAPAVDVLLDDGVVLDGVAYTESSGRLLVDSGIRNIKVNAAGTDATVIEADLDLVDGQNYTVVAVNNLAAIEPLVLNDQRDPVPLGEVSVRVVHGAPSAPAVDVYVTAPDADLEEAQPVLQGVPFKGFSDYLTIPAGTYQLRVTLAGTKTVAIDSGALNLGRPNRLTVFARDNVGGGAPFSFLILDDR